MPTTSTGQIVVSGTTTPQNPATFQVTAAGRPTQVQVGLVPSTSPYAFYQQIPVNALPQGGIAGNALTFGGLTLAPNAPGWTLISSEGGGGFVHGEWQYGATPQARTLPAQDAFYYSNRGGSGTGGGGGSNSDEPGVFNQAQGFRLTNTGWLIAGLVLTLLLTDNK